MLAFHVSPIERPSVQQEAAMSSHAYTNYLEVLLADAIELNAAHTRLRTGQPGRQWGLGAVNRPVVVLCVSAWEAYLEELIKEAIETMRPSGPALGIWPALKAQTLSDAGRFNNPNVENAMKLFATILGLTDVTLAWSWRNSNRDSARGYLNEALSHRHQIAHGVSPRPTIHNDYARWLPAFFRNLGNCTDNAVRDHLVNSLGILAPW